MPINPLLHCSTVPYHAILTFIFHLEIIKHFITIINPLFIVHTTVRQGECSHHPLISTSAPFSQIGMLQKQTPKITEMCLTKTNGYVAREQLSYAL